LTLADHAPQLFLKTSSMKVFECACGARVFFENSRCLTCQRELGFIPSPAHMEALDLQADGSYRAASDGSAVHKCANYDEHGVCNWLLLPDDSTHTLCQACRLNNVVPDVTVLDNRDNWAAMETSKRRLIYTLNALGLPILPMNEDPQHGLAFDIKSDLPGQRVLTGHSEGLITINLAEASPSIREKVRHEMNERYRTLLGHFRHETGHYYWELLIAGSKFHDAFRTLFGDEVRDYVRALALHYEKPKDFLWDQEFISAYASCHPWEDWAETWAHYLHMVDTMETAGQFGLGSGVPEPLRSSQMPMPRGQDAFDQFMLGWMDLTIALNALNRSMGLADAYPFSISPRVQDKLRFVHQVLTERGSEPFVAATARPTVGQPTGGAQPAT